MAAVEQVAAALAAAGMVVAWVAPLVVLLVQLCPLQSPTA